MKTASASADFNQRYQTHLKHLKLKGLQPKTIDALSPSHPAHGRLL